LSVYVGKSFHFCLNLLEKMKALRKSRLKINIPVRKFCISQAVGAILFLGSGALTIVSFAANSPARIEPSKDSAFLANSGKLSKSRNVKPSKVPLTSTGIGWSIVDSANVSVGQTHQLNGVACASATECWAAGYYGSGPTFQTIVERWDGLLWSIVSSPNSSVTQANYIYGVTCASANECWTVGYYYNGSAKTLIEEWDGSSWSITASPNASTTTNNYLYSVTCTAGDECWAVGSYSTGTAFQTLIEKWNGLSWSIVSSPNAGTLQDNYLYGVTCSSTSECWAVGNVSSSSGSQTLIEKWDGTSWSIVSSPNPDTAQNDTLSAVNCAPAGGCWAVGYYYSDNGTAQTLIEKWNGTLWSIVSSPNSSATQANFLNSVACASANECWAAGQYDNPTTQTLIEKWNGTSWSIVSSPNASTTETNSLNSVACTSALQCWAVGEYFNGSVFQTLVEKYTITLTILSITHPAGNTIHLQCLGVPDALNRIEFSPDLSPGSFTTLAQVSADAAGAFQYDDTNAGAAKFYRLAYP
jgi:hypothetical protein